MNALELADELDRLEIVCRRPSELIGNETHEQAALRCNPNLTIKKDAATMLRQQQAKIEELKILFDKTLNNWAKDMERNK